MNSSGLNPERWLAVSVLAAAAFLAAPAVLRAADPSDLAAIVGSMPNADGGEGKYTGPDPATALRAVETVLQGGQTTVIALARMLVEPGQGEDYKARYLLHALATHAARPGAETERLMVCEALVSLLGGSTPKGVQAKILEELKWVGAKESAEPISRLLLDETLYACAADALVAIGGTEGQLRRALVAAKGRVLVGIIQALGTLRDAQSVGPIKAALGAPDADVRTAAAAALGNIGDPAAVDALLAATQAHEGYERTMATEASLVLAKRLLEAGRATDAEKIYRAFWTARKGPEDRHVRVAALKGLAASRSDGAIEEVMAATKTEDVMLRTTAAQIAAVQSGEAYTRRWLSQLEGADPAQRIDILGILGQRGDPAALPSVLALISDQDAGVRAAALGACARIGGESAAKALIGVLAKGEGDNAAFARAGLIQMAGGSEVDSCVGAALKAASSAGVRAALLGILAARGATGERDLVLAAVSDQDPAVRRAAIEALGALAGERELPVLVKTLQGATDPNERQAAEGALVAAAERVPPAAVHAAVIPALRTSADAVKPALLRALGKAGGPRAFEAFQAHADDKDPAVRDAAIRLLADVRDPAAMAPLLKIAQKTDNETHQVLALRSVVQLARTGVANPDLRVRLYAEVLQTARRADEKRLAIGAAGDVPTPAALEFVAAQLDAKDLAEEAAAAAVRICQRMSGGDPARRQAVLQKVMEVSHNRRTVGDAAKMLGVSPPRQ